MMSKAYASVCLFCGCQTFVHLQKGRRIEREIHFCGKRPTSVCLFCVCQKRMSLLRLSKETYAFPLSSHMKISDTRCRSFAKETYSFAKETYNFKEPTNRSHKRDIRFPALESHELVSDMF